MKWQEEYKVHYYYTDYKRILKPSYICRYMQETANSGLKNFNITADFMVQNNCAFILSKISFKYYAPIFEDDIIKVQTWALPPKTTIFQRNYRIYRGSNIVVEATSAWALINIKEKAIIRPEKFQYITDDMTDSEEVAFQVQKRLKMPEDMQYLTDYTIRYSDIDHNLHMNNAVYIDIICDCIYNQGERLDEGSNKKIDGVNSIEISYNSEALFGDMLEITKGVIITENADINNGGSEEHYIKAKNKSNGLNCFEAKVNVSTKA